MIEKISMFDPFTSAYSTSEFSFIKTTIYLNRYVGCVAEGGLTLGKGLVSLGYSSPDQEM